MSRKFRLPIIIGSAVTIFILIAAFGSIALAQDGVSPRGPAGAGQVNSELSAPESEGIRQGVGASEGQVNSEVTAPVPGGPGYVALSAMAFQPYLPTDQVNHSGQTLYCLGGNCVYDAEINLPNGAIITKFVVYYYDNAASDLTAYLYRGPFDYEYAWDMAIAYSSGTGTGIRYSEDTTIITPVIDNQSNVYLAEVWLPATSSVRLIGVRVDYAYPTGLPLVEK